jgi:hypothetical protein
MRNRLSYALSAATLMLSLLVASAETEKTHGSTDCLTATETLDMCVEIVEHAPTSALNYMDDTRQLPAVPVEEVKQIFKDQKCELRDRGTKVPSWGCNTTRSGCEGACLHGVYRRPARVCVPSQGSECVASLGFVEVTFTHIGVCNRQCECTSLILLDEPIRTRIPAWRCNI